MINKETEISEERKRRGRIKGQKESNQSRQLRRQGVRENVGQEEKEEWASEKEARNRRK